MDHNAERARLSAKAATDAIGAAREAFEIGKGYYALGHDVARSRQWQAEMDAWREEQAKCKP